MPAGTAIAREMMNATIEMLIVFGKPDAMALLTLSTPVIDVPRSPRRISLTQRTY